MSTAPITLRSIGVSVTSPSSFKILAWPQCLSVDIIRALMLIEAFVSHELARAQPIPNLSWLSLSYQPAWLVSQTPTARSATPSNADHKPWQSISTQPASKHKLLQQQCAMHPLPWSWQTFSLKLDSRAKRQQKNAQFTSQITLATFHSHEACPPAFILPSSVHPKCCSWLQCGRWNTNTHTHTSSHRNLSDFYLCLSLMSTAMIANSNRHCAHPPRWTYIPVELGGPRSEVLDVLPKHSMYANKNMLTVSTGS